MINTKQVHRINDDKLMTGKQNMGTRGGETQDMGNTGLTIYMHVFVFIYT